MMTKVIRCRDVGFDCQGIIRTDSEEEAVAQAAQHAKDVHGVKEISDELAQAVNSAIRDE